MPEATPVPAAIPEKPRRYEIPVFLPGEPEESGETPKEPAVPATAEGDKAPAAQDTEGQAPSAASEGDKPSTPTPEQAAKREGRRFERKLDKAYRQRAEAQARAELLEKRLAELEKPKSPEGEPKLEQFDFDPEKYATAKAEYAKSQAAKDFEARQRTQAATETQQRLMAAWEEKVERADDKYDDFEQVVGKLEPNSPFVAAIMEAENGEDIAYYLGKNHKVAERIVRLSPLSQVREIGKLEAKLLAEPEKPKTPSKAPAPITPLTGTAPLVTGVPSEDEDIGTWIKKRSKQVHGSRIR